MSSAEPYALVAIGGGPAGLAAAQAFRRAQTDGRIGLIADERRVPYQRPAVSKELLRGQVSAAEIALEDEGALAEQRIELIAGRAVDLDVRRHAVILSGGRELRYRRCVLAPGAEPIRLTVAGADDPAVRTLRSIDDLRELQNRLEPAVPVVVVGSGFIGCEIATSLRSLGHPVVVCTQEDAPNVGRVGEPPAAEIARWLDSEGVDLRLGAELRAIERSGGRLRVVTTDGDATAGLVVMATGVSPRAELAAQAGAGLEDGAVLTDARMRTGLPDVLAAGDVARAEHLIAERRLRTEHWGDALAQGEVAGRTAAGQPSGWAQVPGFWTEIGGRTLKYAGWGERFDELRWEPHGTGFVAWYRGGDRLVGVLTHERDADYEHGQALIGQAARWT